MSTRGDPRRRQRCSLALGLAAALSAETSAQAQILGGGLPGGIGGIGGGFPPVDRGRPSLPMDGLPRRPTLIPPVRPSLALPDPAAALSTAPVRLVDAADKLADVPLQALRKVRADRLLRDHAEAVEADERGEPVVRGEVLAVTSSADAVARARQAGFDVRSREPLPGLGLESVVLGVPRGMPATEAVRRLREMDPAGQYDFNHIYQESGAAAAAAITAVGASAAVSARGLRIGLVDGAVAARQPTLAGARLVQRSFAPGGSRATAHATTVASLMVGSGGRFRGAAPGATLYVADVYGPTSAGGSATAIAQALSWLAQNRTPVINISLVGPPNLLLKSAVEALTARGYLVVAAVGNDGPAAAPLYPAAYAGVVAVTGVDGRRRVLPEAGRGDHVDFAAPGDLAAASADGGFIRVRGTSFAAPLAAGALARLLPSPDPAAASRAVEALARDAADLGEPGPDTIYGRGLVGFELRTDPVATDGRGARRRP
jgi:hypothetical protein